MDKLIENYEIELVEAGCAPGSGRWGVQVNLFTDISAVFPYLNAVMDNARYDHQNQVLAFRERGRAYAFRPYELRSVGSGIAWRGSLLPLRWSRRLITPGRSGTALLLVLRRGKYRR